MASFEWKNKVIRFNDCHLIPKRIDLINQVQRQHVDKLIQTSNKLNFMPTYLYEMNVQDKKYVSAEYKILLFGVLSDGRRTVVMLDGIKPHFDVRVPDEMQNKKSADVWAQTLIDDMKSCLDKYDATKRRFEISDFEVIDTYRPIRYLPVETKCYYVRIYFTKSNHRKDAISYIRSKNHQTACDDAQYYRIVCRNRRITFSSWCTLDKYVSDENSRLKGSFLRVNIEDFAVRDTSELEKDKTLCCYWDTETWSPDRRVPMPEIASHKLIMISMVFYQCYESKPLFQVCIVDQPSLPHEEFLTIVATSEAEMVRAFGLVFEKMQPEFLGGFNSSNYDMPWLVMRGSETPGVLEDLAKCMDSTIPWSIHKDSNIFNKKIYLENKEKYNNFGGRSNSGLMQSDDYKHKTLFVTETTKIEAELSINGYTLAIPGYLDIDVQIIFRQLYPKTTDYSLKYFLEINALKGKKEMPIEQLHDIYTTIHNQNGLKWKHLNSVDKDLATQYRDIAQYCVYDSIRCHELMNKRNRINENRDFASLVYLSLEDLFKRAGGVRVRNLAYSEAWSRQHIGSNMSNQMAKGQKFKFPGAYVKMPTHTGLYAPKLTLDERVRKYLYSLTVEQIWQLYSKLVKDRLKLSIGVVSQHAETDVTVTSTANIKALKKRIVDKGKSESDAICKEFSLILDTIVDPDSGGHIHWKYLDVKVASYRPMAQLTEKEMQYWKAQIQKHGVCLTAKQIDMIENNLS